MDEINLADLMDEMENDPHAKGAVLEMRAATEMEKVKPISHEEMMNAEIKPLEHVLFPWLPVQGIAFIYAASGVGKTLFAMNVAYAIAGGGEFLKFKAPAPRKVLYIDGEMAYSQVLTRYREIVKQQGALEFPENWLLFTPDKFLPHRLPKICTVEGQDLYVKYFLNNKVDVVVFDNLSMLSDIDENKSNEWKIVQDWLLKLRAMGLSVIVIHHAGKDKSGYRGTSRMLDAADSALSLQAIDQDLMEFEKAEERKFKITYHKARSFGGADAFPFEVTLQAGGWGHRSIEQTNMDMIVERINMGMKQFVIAKEFGWSQPYVSKMVKSARRRGLIRD